MRHPVSPLILSFSRKGRRDGAASKGGLPLPTASASGGGLFSLRARQGEFDREKMGVRGLDPSLINDFGY